MNKLIFILSLFFSTLVSARGVYLSPQEFLTQEFPDKIPKPSLVWLTSEIRPTVEKILAHKPSTLRLRYWRKAQGSVWILNEIGKEKPITTGIVVRRGRIARISVLIFRESRGWEIKESFFTQQFNGASLNSKVVLDRSIDGISGATLSVRAMKKMASLALFLDKQVSKKP